MKINYKLILFNLFILVFFGSQSSFAQNVSSQDLIRQAKKYDGQIVTYSGEVIGDLMRRKDFAWVNLKDMDNAVAVWITAEMAKVVQFTGNYKTQGDLLEVTGIFYRNCLEHGGDLDIHAQTLRKISSGRVVVHQINLKKLKLIFILFGVLFFIWILTLFRRR